MLVHVNETPVIALVNTEPSVTSTHSLVKPGFVMKHELGHALDMPSFASYFKNRLYHEMVADVFAALLHLRQHPEDFSTITKVIKFREGFIRQKDFMTSEALKAAFSIAQSGRHLTCAADDLICMAQSVAETASNLIPQSHKKRAGNYCNPSALRQPK